MKLFIYTLNLSLGLDSFAPIKIFIYTLNLSLGRPRAARVCDWRSAAREGHVTGRRNVRRDKIPSDGTERPSRNTPHSHQITAVLPCLPHPTMHAYPVESSSLILVD